MSGHYTATVEVCETAPARETTTTGGYRRPAAETKTEREVRDPPRVVVRSDSIERPDRRTATRKPLATPAGGFRRFELTSRHG